MSDRLLDRQGATGPNFGTIGPRRDPGSSRLGQGVIDRRRLHGCLGALGVVGVTLLAGLALLLALALASPDRLRGVRLAAADQAVSAAPIESAPAALGSNAVS